MANEMAHYATDCWDAEIENSVGGSVLILRYLWLADLAHIDGRSALVALIGLLMI